MKKLLTIAVLVGLFTVMAVPAMAFTAAPVPGSVFYEAYDLVVNNFLHGAMGFICAVLLVALGVGAFIMQKIVPGIIALVCAGIIYRIDSIVTSLGANF